MRHFSSRAAGHTWRDISALMKRPQAVTIPMVLLFAIIPVYLFIGHALIPGRVLYAPAVAWDQAIPLWPAWSLVYGSLLLAALLPVFVVHQQELVRRVILAFVSVWLFSYAVFIAYPTVSPRPQALIGDDFFTWTLRGIYASDIRYNCFPSLHVAQCFLAAFACHRVHRGVGIVAMLWAALVGMATLYTKQHYVLDVIAGAFIAWSAHLVFLRGFPREAVPANERRLAPILALIAVGIYGLVVAGVWLIYQLDKG